MLILKMKTFGNKSFETNDSLLIGSSTRFKIWKNAYFEIMLTPALILSCFVHISSERLSDNNAVIQGPTDFEFNEITLYNLSCTSKTRVAQMTIGWSGIMCDGGNDKPLCLFMPDPVKDQGKTVRCRVNSSSGPTAVAEHTISIKWTTKAKVIYFQSEEILTNEDSAPSRLVCLATGLPRPDINIYFLPNAHSSMTEKEQIPKNGVDTEIGQYTRRRNYSLIHLGHCSHPDIYRCDAQNSDGNESRDFIVFPKCAKGSRPPGELLPAENRTILIAMGISVFVMLIVWVICCCRKRWKRKKSNVDGPIDAVDAISDDLPPQDDAISGSETNLRLGVRTSRQKGRLSNLGSLQAVYKRSSKGTETSEGGLTTITEESTMFLDDSGSKLRILGEVSSAQGATMECTSSDRYLVVDERSLTLKKSDRTADLKVTEVESNVDVGTGSDRYSVVEGGERQTTVGSLTSKKNDWTLLSLVNYKKSATDLYVTEEESNVDAND